MFQTAHLRNRIEELTGRRAPERLEVLTDTTEFMNTLALAGRLAVFKDVEIRKAPAPDLAGLPGGHQQLGQVVLNLLMNAAEGMASKGSIETATSPGADGKTVQLTVADSGPGIPPEVLDRISEPFFSTKTTHGLGLAVSWGIVDRHRGRIEAENRKEGGALSRVTPPAREDTK